MADAPELELLPSQSRQLSWYLAVRLVVVCLFLGGTLVYQLQSASWSGSPLARYLVVLAFLTIAQTAFSASLLPRLTRYHHFVNAQLSWDLLFVVLLIYLTGGVVSPFSFFFVLIIIAAAVFCPRSQLLVVASASSILYGSLLDLQFYGYLPLFRGQPIPKNVTHYDVFYTVFLHVGAFFLTALLSGALAERLRRSEEARHRREIDYDELERLNQAILANINSGLMVVNPNGRIRSFNNAAAKITGYRLEEVYNRPIEAIFPEFDQVDPKGATVVVRGETVYRRQEMGTLILGYSATRVVDSDGSSLGLLIAFQDLTEYKALEEQLNRSDRLAAVGRMASGLAHEIRNPLASISGSIQLMLEDAAVREEDQRLMRIVVKEADRLSRLLSDFLDFARPSPLELKCVDMALMIDELVELLSASGQFQGVVIEKLYRGPIMMNVDRQKMHQILWDLLINAGEACAPDGRIQLAVNGEKGEIVIEDSGAGISEEDQRRLFEPFFTTKEKGTGLGLANVYANIEAHNGTIFIEPAALGGARFVIELPDICRSACRQEQKRGDTD